MTSPSLDARLSGLYRGLDASPDFDAGVMARVHAEAAALEAGNRARARAEEARRYELARRKQGWGAWFRRIVTPHTLGAAALTGFGVDSLWAGIQSQAGPFVAAYGPVVMAYAPLALAVLGIALAGAAPLLLLQNHRRMSRAA